MKNLTNNYFSKKIMASTLTGIMIVSSIGLVALSQNAVANDNKTSDNATAAKRFNKLLKNTKNMTADFSQKTVGGQTGGTYRGSMVVQRPNNLRWETKSPSEQLIIADSTSMWIYDKDLEQATKQSVDNQIGNTPALLLSGDHKKIADSFTITQPHAGKNYYKLLPKSSTANFKSMTLSFSNGKPVMMVLNDNLGQTTSIKFTNIKLNSKISESKFKFNAPKGIDVIVQ